MKVEVKVVGWDQKCSFSMFGEVGSDAMGRFVRISDTDKFYFPDDAILFVREFAQAAPAPTPEKAPEQPPAPVKPTEVEQPQAPMGKPSRAHELAVLARKMREKNLKKAEKAEKKKAKKKLLRPPTSAEAPLEIKKVIKKKRVKKVTEEVPQELN